MKRVDAWERFWSKVALGDGCWEWRACRHPDGYGELSIKGLPGRSNRASWVLSHGPIPDGMSVLHRCDNRPCVRPSHLFLGTQADNVADMHSKGRGGHAGQPPGSRHSMAKLSESDIPDIRRRRAGGEHLLSIARSYGVSIATVSLVARRLKWGHVP